MNETSLAPRSLVSMVRSPFARYQDVMVHLDGGREDEIRLAHAEGLAALAGGRLTGLFTNPLPDIAVYVDEQGTMAAADVTEAVKEKGRAIFGRLQERFGRLGVQNEIRMIEDISAFIPQQVVTEARWADLFVASCPYRGKALHDWDKMVETVLFEGGHGVYLVPRGVLPREKIRTAMASWLDTKEAARAIAEALPFFELATTNDLVSISEPEKGREATAEGMADIAAHLSRHGVKTTVTVMPSRDSVVAGLLDHAHRISADLIVCGAYGHSRFREWMLGGVTRDLICLTDLPLLMAH